MKARRRHALPSALLTGLCALVCGALLASAPPALAKTAHFFTSSFGSLSKPGSIAVDDSTGDVYVLDLEANTVTRFTATGEPAPFSSLGSNVLSGFSFYASGAGQVAVDNSSGPTKGDIYVADTFNNRVAIFAPNGESLGALTGANAPTWGLVCGVAVGASGEVYVSIYGTAIHKYVPSANPVTDSNYQASLEGAGIGGVCNLAADSAGNVYSNELFAGKVTKFEAKQFGTSVAGGATVATTAKGLVYDPILKRVDVDTGSQIVEYDDSSLAQVGAFTPESTAVSFGVGIDGASGRAFVANDSEKTVEAFTAVVTLPDIAVGAPSSLTETSATLNATVNPLGVDTTCKIEYGTERTYGTDIPCSPTDLGAGSAPVPITAALSGLVPGVLYHYRVLTTSTAGTERGVDQTVRAGIKPVIDSEGVTNVTVTSATVSAQINPMFFASTFRVKYGTSTSYGASAPAPDSQLGSAGIDQSVVWTLGELQPSTVYHFRFVATDAFGSIAGPDQVFTTLTAPGSASGSCPNAAIRQQQRATYLPDCRAFELVSPAEKGSADIASDPTRDESSLSGEAVKYWSTVAFGQPLGSAVPGAEYISRRGPEGWSTEPITPDQVSPSEATVSSQYVDLTPELSEGVFYALSPLSPGHPNVAEAGSNLYLNRNVLSALPTSFELLSDAATPQPYYTPSLAEGPGVAFAGASTDLSHIAFESYRNLTPETAGLDTNLPKAYEWYEGADHLVGILPNSACGTPPCVAPGSVIGDGAGGGHGEFNEAYFLHNAISADGTRVVFAAGPLTYEFGPGANATPSAGGGGLYMRIDGRETLQLNVSERSEPDPNGPQSATFMSATAEDSKVFFLTSQALTNDAVPNPGEQKLYMYDFNASAGHHLTLLSVDQDGLAQGNGETGFLATQVLGVSEDGSYVYFYGEKKLLPGQAEKTAGFAVYVWHEGTLRHIADYDGTGGSNDPAWGEHGVLSGTQFRITPDGHTAVFTSGDRFEAERAGISNRSPDCTNGNCQLVYVYNYESNKLVCASCGPAGDPPDGNAMLSEKQATGTLAHPTQYLSRAVTNDGRYVFFSSDAALLPQATNGRWNAYEFDTQTLQLHLISSGTCACNSMFVDASADGRNVFFTTREQLVREDIDNNLDLYDARVEGGIPSQNQPQPLPCTGDACQGQAESAPSLSLPASTTFSGIGNPTPTFAAAGKAAAKSTALKKQKKARKKTKKKAKAKQKTRAKKSARHSSRRAGR